MENFPRGEEPKVTFDSPEMFGYAREVAHGAFARFLRCARPTGDSTPFPAEEFVYWLASELGVQVLMMAGDDRQFELAKRIAGAGVLERWPLPAAGGE